MLDQLKALHQTSWQRRGQPGCFATPAFEAFHRDLIRTCFGNGEIQLLAATAGEQPIGYLYNFVHRDRVYAYQSGFDYAADGRLKPGLLTHALAIEHATRAGFAVYDLMAGANRLKASFASHGTEMVWLGVRRPAGRSALWSWLLSKGCRSRGQGATGAAIGLNSLPDRTCGPAADHVAAARS
jgi:CelD/BcsL family acetyltransferase involved in cellulose biosynthesis